MKKCIMGLAILVSAIMFLPMVVKSQDEDRIISDSKKAKAEFIKTDKLMESLFDHSYGYVIFPNVGKGAVGVGGAAGQGAVFEKGKAIGTARMIQVTAGFQFGGQAYREVIFFEDKDAMDRFKANNLEFSGQASATAVKEGAATNVKYRNGVMVFSQEKGGLMLEAAIGGQKFTYQPLK